MNSPKLKGSLIKRLDIDEVNGTERLHMQLSYSQFCQKIIRKVQWTRMILKFPERASYILLGR